MTLAAVVPEFVKAPKPDDAAGLSGDRNHTASVCVVIRDGYRGGIDVARASANEERGAAGIVDGARSIDRDLAGAGGVWSMLKAVSPAV